VLATKQVIERKRTAKFFTCRGLITSNFIEKINRTAAENRLIEIMTSRISVIFSEAKICRLKNNITAETAVSIMASTIEVSDSLSFGKLFLFPFGSSNSKLERASSRSESILFCKFD